ncbi:hypothetical protein [Methylocystis heyeri]|uniref:Phage major capsid protein n=1 Tax=Methylocystis heyeri TaxID=391905 RepID=A0A6B8KI01_9HYPH|nr:hypothetical protein [Methylocystis heyeri]QGM46120.1 hypothetical protein H2LOC_010675 [Methylocystis heyeri]
MAIFPIASATSTPPLYPAGSANPDYQAAGFIPEIWSGKLIEKFYAATVLAAISNTDYEGEIKSFGDKVNIRTKPTVQIFDYAIDGDLSVDRPVGGMTTLQIDKGKYFQTILDDIIEVQSDINQLNMWSDDAAEQMKITIDRLVLQSILGQAQAANRGTSAGRISGNINLGVTGTPLGTVGRNPGVGQVEILDVILRLGQALDEQNIPEQGRWIIMPTWAAAQIKRSELRQVYLSGDNVTMLRNGRLGSIDRFTIYASNLLPSGTAGSQILGQPLALAAGEFAIYAGHSHALTFASQFTKVETLRSERTFGTLFRGLQVFGFNVLDGIALAQAIVTQAGA